jgi:hypothetical protein
MDDITDVKCIRLFFYLQLWRTHICDEHFQLDENVAEKMRQFLLGHKEIDVSELTNYPLSICYLETPSNEEYTRNRVEVRNNKNPYVIFMNDFIICFYDSIELVGQKYHDLINYKEKEVFRVFICCDEQRKQFLENNSRSDADDFLEKQKKLFIDKWLNKLGKEPEQSIINEYLATLAEGDIETDALKYSVERIAKLQNDIISKYMRINKDKKNTTGITIKRHKGVISNSRNKHTKNKRHKFCKWIWIKKIYKRIKRRKREK